MGQATKTWKEVVTMTKPRSTVGLDTNQRGGMGRRWVGVMWSGMVCLLLVGVMVGQDARPDAAAKSDEAGQIDKVSQDATRLEAELGKFKDSSTEAADVMVKLTDLYHQHGRLFGLIRVAGRFVASHPTDTRHRAVLLKLIDGLDAASRHNDFVASTRQWLERYPKDPAAAGLEIRLAAVLARGNDRRVSGVAHEAVYRRSPGSVDGRRHAITAVQHYAAVNNKAVYSQAARLAEELLGVFPVGVTAEETGFQAVAQWQRGNEWAKSNAAATRMLQKGLPRQPEAKRRLHVMMAENYGRLGQWANATGSYAQARAIRDSQDTHYAAITALANNQAAKPAQMAPVVNDYIRKFPSRPDRFDRLGHLAAKYEAAKDLANANRIFAQLLPLSARTHSAAAAFVRTRGTMPADFAASERTLIDAINRNPDQADKAYLRYTLAFDVYRDRMKQLEKTRATLRQLVSSSPSNDSFATNAASWLFSNATSDAEFNADVNRYLAARKTVPEHGNFRGVLAGWISSARRNKATRNRAASAKALLQNADRDPLIAAWVAGEGNNKKGSTARASIISGNLYKQLSDQSARNLLSRQAYYLRVYTASSQRSQSTTVYGQLAQRFPKEYQLALDWLAAATDYGPAEAAGEAARHVMSLQANASSADVFRRLLIAADMNKSTDLARAAHTWIVGVEKTHGPAYTYAYQVGDTLKKYKLDDLAVAYWRSHIGIDRNHYDSYYCVGRVLATLEDAQKTAFLVELLKHESDYHGSYAAQLANHHFRLEKPNLAEWEKVARASRARQDARGFRSWSFDENIAQGWVDTVRGDKEATEALKRQVYTLVRDLRIGRPSAAATLALLELPAATPMPATARLLAYQSVTTQVGTSTTDWDRLMPYVQAALAREDYMAAATLASGMLANITSVDDGRRKSGRNVVAQSYSRVGAVGLTIDENSPLAPLLQAALSLRLGDRELALETYNDNRELFDQHRDEVPADLVLFVCEHHIAAGGDENHGRVEDILRGWVVKHSESKQFDDQTKAKVQLLLARNFAKAQRYDLARNEFTTVKNRYPETSQATEAEFGIGETFLAQKVFDQAELVFEKLANSRELDVVIRAEFLRGVLAHRRGDRDEARAIFRGVLDRVPSIELANQALYSLSEVYRDEERYIDQLNLLRTVGRLGRNSKRTHAPGLPLSIVVQDSDLGISRGHNRIPVIVTTEPGGDVERVFLISGGAGKGLFRVDLPTELGPVQKGDRKLQVTGQDKIRCDYPDAFKQEFKKIPLSDVDIIIAADGEFAVSSSRIIDSKEETFSQRLEREAREREESDQRVSQQRPANQIKPGNPVYLRVKDRDRDFGDEFDQVVVKLTAESGDEVQVTLKETSPHSGVFEGMATTGELPAGAQASDTAIEHSPLMAIDRDPMTFWQSEPDGATPKQLTIDMKDLKLVSRVRLTSPDPDNQVPVRGILYGSNDGRFWFRLAGNPPQELAAEVFPKPKPVEEATAQAAGKKAAGKKAAGKKAAGGDDPSKLNPDQMAIRLYNGNYTSYSNWNQVVSLGRNAKPFEIEAAEALKWARPEDPEDEKAQAKPFAAIWSGMLVQEREGAARISVTGQRTAIAIDGRLELPLGPGNRTVDVYLEQGTHQLTIFAATTAGATGVQATIARADHNSAAVTMLPFRSSDWDLSQKFARPALAREDVQADFSDGEWAMQFEPRELRYVRFDVLEYRGEAVALSNVEVTGEEPDQKYIPTQADVLALSNNQTLEIAGGDVVTATYTDELTQRDNATSRLLTGTLTATYYNGTVTPIDYDLVRANNGGVNEIRKRLMRVDPGDKVVIEIIDYDRDASEKQDEITFDVILNDGEAREFTATETQPYSGIFTKEIFTGDKPGDKIDFVIKPGDRLYVRYIDSQNTFPGHAVPRETVVLVNQPSEAQITIIESRLVPPPEGSESPARPIYSYRPDDRDVSRVAFETPLTVEVIDPDRAKDSRSSLIVKLRTSDGATVDVNCVISSAYGNLPQGAPGIDVALEEGRFVGQVILQLGSAGSPAVVPVTADMPRGLIGGPVLVNEDGEEELPDSNLVTRVLNLTGKDRVILGYNDASRPDGAAKLLEDSGRLISNGELAVTDRDYQEPVTQLHVGERLFLKVEDADQDTSDERDAITVEITSEFGEKERVVLNETLVHSGVFTGSLALKSNEKPVVGNLDPETPVIECYFGDTIHLKYTDPVAGSENGSLERTADIPVVIGTDGLVAAFSKTFNDENLAVETKFHIAESYFELFKSHKKLGRDDQKTADLQNGRRVLREVMEDYPDPKYVPRISYLLGQFSQELEQWAEAIEAYELIVKQYAEHSLAPDAQYKLAQCYELSGDFDQALEGYVTLAATYPKNPLIANVMIRICDHFYKKEIYDVAAQVGEKFLEKFGEHEHAARIAFRIGQCHYKAEKFADAGGAFDRFAKRFPDDELCADSLFWAGESYRMGSDNRTAFRRYNNCRWDFPASDAAKYARGRLALPEMLQQFEAEAASLEDNN